MQRYVGGCHCGHVRFELWGPPMQALYCHCSVCRGTTGSPYLMVGFWRPDRTQTIGTLLERPTSDWLMRHRCAECGAAIYNAVRSERLASNNFMLPLLSVRDAAVQPTHHIYYADRIMDIEDDLPRFDGFQWLSATMAGG